MQKDESGFAADDSLVSNVVGASSDDSIADPNSDDSAPDGSWSPAADLTVADGQTAGSDRTGIEDFHYGKRQGLLADAATLHTLPTSETGQGFSWNNSIESLQSGSLTPDPGSPFQTTDGGTDSEASGRSTALNAESGPIVAAVTLSSGAFSNPSLAFLTPTGIGASTQPALTAQIPNSLPDTVTTTSAAANQASANQWDAASLPQPINLGPTLGGDTDLLASGSNSQSVSGGTAGSSGTGGGTVLSVTSNSSAFVINLTFDSSCASAPAGFETDVEEVAQYYESLFNDPITISIDVGYGEVDGSAVGGALGSSLYYENGYTYSQVKNTLVASNAPGTGTLPGTDPTGGGFFLLPTAEAKAIGLASGSSTDGYIGFNSGSNTFDYDNSNGVTGGQYDFFGVVAHEISEVMGRMFPGSGYYSALSLFDFTSAGTRDLGGSPPGYFSINNGTTNLDNFNTNASGDYGDWAGSAGANSYLAFANPGTTLAVTSTDATVMSALGWTLTTPAAPIISNDTINVNNSVTLTGTAIAAGTVSVYDGSTLLGTTTAADSEAWSFTTSALSNGTHSITATVTDPGGTSAASNAVDPIIGSSSGPTISSLTETPSSGDLDAGKTVTLTLTLSEVVTVAGGTPTLTLNDGGSANYTSGSGSNALTFSYIVGAAQNTSGLQATAVNLNSATITDGSGNAANLSLFGLTQTGPQIDTTAPTIASLTESPSSGDLNAGKTVTLTLNLSEVATVASGTPTLTLNDGGTATYISGSGTSALTFNYTVGSGQNAAGLTATAVNLGSATITDGAGNAANLSLSGLTQTGPKIDTAAPTTASLTESPASGDLDAGKIVTLTLNLSEVVTVAGGTPTLTLNDGSTASYVSGSGTNALTFSYAVGAGQNTAGLQASAVNLGSATITDGAGNAANLSLSGLTQTGPQIDTTAPTIASLTESPASGDLDAGKTVTLTLNLSEVITVAGGTPTLTLNDGGTASYVSGSGTSALTFSYTVGAGQNTAGLQASAINLGAATITDGAGNAANLSLSGLTQTGPQIDTTAPAIASLTESPSSGVLDAGKAVTLTVNLSEAVTIAGGTPTLTLNDGGTATYASGSGTSVLTFSYTVGAGQDTTGLQATAVNLGSATITDAAANTANLSLSGLTQTGPQIDTATPIVSSLTETPSSGDFNIGNGLTLTLNLSEAVTVAGGTPTLTLNDGGSASYVSGSGTNTLTFSYAVGAGQNTAGLTATAVNLNAANITDSAGNAANLSLSGLTQTGPKIDTTTPTIASLTDSPSSGDLDAGKTVTLTLNLSEAVTVTGGIPTLALNDGGTASYVSGSGTNALTFSYTVGAGQNIAGLTATAVNLNSAAITDGAGNAANLSLSGLSQTGPQIDTVAPTIASLTETPSSGDLDAGKTVTLTLNLSEAVTVAGGTPTLTLNDGGSASYVSGSGTNALTFNYTVGAGQNTTGLQATAVNLGSATVTDGAGNAANLSLSGLTQTGPQIDTTAPTIASLTQSPSTGDLDAGKTVTLTLNLSEVVTVAGGTPTLTLNDGGSASYVGGSGTNALTFNYTVGAGQNTAGLTVTAVTLGSATITDGGGNAANLSLSGLTQTGPQIDTAAPTILSLTESPASGDLDAGKSVTLTLNLNEIVTVAGGIPTLTLNDGGSASYVSGSGTNALTFSYTVGAGQNTAGLTATTVNLNSAIITDAAGNAANLSLSGLTQTGPKIDTTAPTIASLTDSPSSGDLDAGKTVTLTVNLSEAVTVAGGTPTLTLNDGGTASYVSGSGTSALTFSYAVGAGQNTAGLQASAINLGSATITDGAGNAANLSLSGLTQTGPQIDTTAPTIASLTETPSSGDLDAGKTVALTLNLSEAVTVAGGTPTLTLNDGGSASYVSGSGTNALTFNYTVGAGQNTTGLQATAVNLGSATVTDGAGNTANLSLSGLTQTGPQIDTTAPTIASLTQSPSTGDLDAGKTVTLTLNLSEVVTVAGGTPTLTLNDGGSASYVGGSGTNALTFNYTIGAGQNTAGLTATAVNLNPATIMDGAGNATNLSLSGLTQTGPKIDTTAPTISSLSETPSSGDLDGSKTVTLTLNLNEAVIVAGGTPTLTLNDGGTATYTGGTGTSALTFAYTVGAGQNTAGLAATAVNLNLAAITDGAGNSANLSLSGLTQTGPKIDTTAPTISSLIESPASGILDVGRTVALTLNLNEVVTVAGGTPTLTLNDGGTAAYTGGSGSSALTFSYTVAAGQNTSGLQVTAVNLNTAAITDGAGNAANLSVSGLAQTGPQINTVAPGVLALTASPSSGDLDAGKTVMLTLDLSEAVTVTGGTPTVTLNDGGTAIYAGGSGTNALTFSYTIAAGQNTSGLQATAVNLNSASITDGAGNAANLSLSGLTQTGPQIDTTAPTIASLSETPSSGDLNAGKIVILTLTLSEAVTVAGGTPTVTLNDGATATYTGGSGTNALTFSYTVAAGQNTPDLMTTAVNLNSASITDSAGNAANLSLAGVAQGSPAIDTTAPTIASLIETPSTGALNAGNVVTLTLNFAEAVTVTGGIPTLTLNDGGNATYTGGSGTSALTFSYTIAAGQNTSALQATAVNLNTAAITDGAGNAANLSLSGLTQSGPVIDSTPPIVSSLTETPQAGDLHVGKTVALTLNLTAPVTVAGGTPTLTLNDGGTATYTGGSGSNALVFSYTVAAGQTTTNLQALSVNLNSAAITDGAGGAANLSLSGLSQVGPKIGGNGATPPNNSTSSLLMRTGSGAMEIYNIGENGILAANFLGNVGTQWQVVGLGDFSSTAGEHDDMMMRGTGGQLEIYDVGNDEITSAVSIGQVGLEWQVAGVGDFSSRLNETDMLMRNVNTGQFEIYDVSNNQITSAAAMGQVGLEWQVAGFGDFSGNPNETDMLMRNSNTGQFEIYDVSNNRLTSAAPMGQVGLEWQVAGFGDFSSNPNEDDMLMRNSYTGQFELYDISKNKLTSAAAMGQVGLEWQVAGFGDLSGGANESDLLMRNSFTGGLEIYDISHNVLTSAEYAGQVGTEWQTSGVANGPALASTAQTIQAMAAFAPSSSAATPTSVAGSLTQQVDLDSHLLAPASQA